MKKFTYLLAVAAVFTACNSGNTATPYIWKPWKDANS